MTAPITFLLVNMKKVLFVHNNQGYGASWHIALQASQENRKSTFFIQYNYFFKSLSIQRKAICYAMKSNAILSLLLLWWMKHNKNNDRSRRNPTVSSLNLETDIFHIHTT